MTDHTPAPTDKPGLDAERVAEWRREALANRDTPAAERILDDRVLALIAEVERLREEHHPDCRGAVAIAREDRRAAEAARDAAVAERDALRERVTALADDWDDFEHDMVACESYSCPDCTMKNAVHDLRTVIREVAAPVSSVPQGTEVEEWDASDRRDVRLWLLHKVDQRVRYFPQRRDGVDALLRHLAASLVPVDAEGSED